MYLDLNFNPFPELHTEHLVLRRFLISDAPDLYNLRTNEEVMKYQDRPKPRSSNEMVVLIKTILEDLYNNNSINWAISYKGDTRLIGTIGFWRIQKEHLRAEIGYMLLPGFQGRGLMTEALKKVIEYGFTTMNLHSVEANCNPGNSRSINLLEKNGFVKEAFFKENFYYNGKFLDSVIYSLLNKTHKSQ